MKTTEQPAGGEPDLAATGMAPSDIGIVGLGVMGANLALNLSDHGYRLSVYNRTGAVTAEFIETHGQDRAIAVADNFQQLVSQLGSPRVILLMVTAGRAVEAVIERLRPLLDTGDILIDGGNSNYRDTDRRWRALAARGIHFVGMGVSGGEAGARFGPSLMPGGAAAAWPVIRDMFQAIAARVDDVPCCQWLGEGGAGHYVKMVHNGIEYGLMQAYAEGFNILRHANAGRLERAVDSETTPLRNPEEYQYELDLVGIAEVWRRGSVISSWLLDLTAKALLNDPDLVGFSGRVSDSGEGRWTIKAAIDEDVPAPVLTAALFERFNSRAGAEFADKLISAMRFEFGGHQEKHTK